MEVIPLFSAALLSYVSDGKLVEAELSHPQAGQAALPSTASAQPGPPQTPPAALLTPRKKDGVCTRGRAQMLLNELFFCTPEIASVQRLREAARGR